MIYNEIVQHWLARAHEPGYKKFKGLRYTVIRKVPILLTYDFSSHTEAGDTRHHPKQIDFAHPQPTTIRHVKGFRYNIKFKFPFGHWGMPRHQKYVKGTPLINNPLFLSDFLSFIQKNNCIPLAFRLYKGVLLNYNNFKPQQLDAVFKCIQLTLESSTNSRHKRLLVCNKKINFMNKNVVSRIYAMLRHNMRSILSSSRQLDDTSTNRKASKTSLKTYQQTRFKVELVSESIDKILSDLKISPLMQQGELVWALGNKIFQQNSSKIRRGAKILQGNFSFLPVALGFAENSVGELRCGRTGFKFLVEGLLGPFVDKTTDAVDQKQGVLNQDGDEATGWARQHVRARLFSLKPDHGISQSNKAIICDLLIKHLGHPRLNAENWSTIDNKYIHVLLRWQNSITMDQFFKLVDHILKEKILKSEDEDAKHKAQNERSQWSDRKNYWKQHLDLSDIHDVWICLGQDYEPVLSDDSLSNQDKAIDSTRHELRMQENMEYARLSGSTGDSKHCMLLMKTRHHILVEFSHNGALRAYRNDHPSFSKLTLRQKIYSADILKSLKRNEKGWFAHHGRSQHGGASSWQHQVDDYVFDGDTKRRRN